MVMLYRLIMFLMYFMSLLIKEQMILILKHNKHLYMEYKVTNKSNRVGMLLEGPSIKAYYEDMPEYQPVKRALFK